MAPWWVSFAIAAVVFIVLRWVMPASVANNIFLKPLAQMLSGMAWILSGVFVLIGLMSLVREKSLGRKQPALVRQQAVMGHPLVTRPQSAPDPIAVKSGNDDAREKATEWSNELEQVTAKQKPTEWSIQLLRDLEWKRFEDVCQKFYALKGIRSDTTPLGPDGGIDIRLYQDESGKATSIVQCKAWGKRYVGVQPVRELLGVMTHEKVSKAFFMASGNFSEEAKLFAQSNRITLINGEMLVAMIKRLSNEEQQALLKFATEGDFSTPTCPSCGIKMRAVSGADGRSDFWGCQSYPRCRQKLPMRAALRNSTQPTR